MVLPDILRKQVESRGDSTFLRFRDRSVSFARMEETSNRAANLLREIGVRRGDKVCLMISNRPEFLELWFGISKLGAIMVPVDTSLKEYEVSHIAGHSDATVLAVEDSAFFAAEHSVRNLPKIRGKIWIGGIGGIPPGFLDYHETIIGLPRTLSRPPVTEPSDVMSIVYTPGTTGVPKGAMLSQRNYLHSGRIWVDSVVRAAAGDVFYTSLPLSRVHTQTLTVVGAMTSGCPLVLGEGFDALTFVDDLRRCGATVFACTGSMIACLMHTAPRPGDAENPARLAFGGGLPARTKHDFEERFGVRVVEGFGLTEIGGMCIAHFGGSAKTGAIGKPLPGYDVKVVDEFDEELPTGISGEIVLRPSVPEGVFLGYYREHDRTAENMRNGWFHTGDRGYTDDEGNFYFLDRKADCIRNRGEIFPSIEIERIVNDHPKVQESAATGILSELDEEDVRVFIVPRPGETLAPGEITEWCAARLASRLVPRHVELVRELPKTSIAGIRKHELRSRPVAAPRG